VPATKEERIVDETYKAVFILGREQIAAHVCLDSETQRAAHKSMTNMRVSKDDTHVITESTNARVLLRVKEPINRFDIEQYPLDINPSERTDTLLDTPQFIPGETLDELKKQLPMRRNFQKAVWQRSAVFSVKEDGSYEVGRSDKQGKATVDEQEAPKHTATFPPVDKVWKEGDPDYKNMFTVENLKKVVSAMEEAGAELILFKCWQDPIVAANFQSVDRYANPTKREIDALIMPMQPDIA